MPQLLVCLSKMQNNGMTRNMRSGGLKPALSITYHWNNGVLDYRFPLVNGSRSTALALYPHSKDIACIDRNRKPLAYIDQLRRWYGWVSLNKTKNWILKYKGNDGAFPKYFNAGYAGNKLNLGWLQQSLKNSAYIGSYGFRTQCRANACRRPGFL